MRRRFLLISVFAILALAGCFGFFDFTRADQSSGDVVVEMTVPTQDDGGGGGDGPPIITNVSASAAVNTASVTWSSIDDHGLIGMYFNYSTDLNYSLSAAVNGTYGVDLSGLSSGTTYYFRIQAVDTGGHQTIYTGFFVTLPSATINSLTIVAKPEKRVSKPGGNLALPFTLVIYDPVAERTVYTLTDQLDNSGSTTSRRLSIPAGSGYEAILKGQSHLAKKITGVNIAVDQDVVLDFTAGGTFELLCGDTQGAGLKDNLVDILDVSDVDAVFNSDDSDADLNRDGVVDVLDMSAVLVNYNQIGNTWPAT